MSCTHDTVFQCLQCPKPHPNCMECRGQCNVCILKCCPTTMRRCPTCYDLTCPACECICMRRVACLNCNRYRSVQMHIEVHDGERQRWVCNDCMCEAQEIPDRVFAVGLVLVVVAAKLKK